MKPMILSGLIVNDAGWERDTPTWLTILKLIGKAIAFGFIVGIASLSLWWFTG